MSRIPHVLETQENELLADWLAEQRAATRGDAPRGAEVERQSREVLGALRAAVKGGRLDGIDRPEWAPVREVLGAVARARALMGESATQVASFLLSLRRPLVKRLEREHGDDAKALFDECWAATLLIDRLGLYITELHQRNREDVILRQQQEMLELSTPVVKLWDGILALPLIGTLDSSRTQVVMETLLDKVVETGCAIAIIDITGVPTVDTLVAQHLLKTVAAARLMGADCIISGIRPQIAQTIVHLGIDLTDVTTKATLADAFQVALERSGQRVVADPAAAYRDGDRPSTAAGRRLRGPAARPTP